MEEPVDKNQSDMDPISRKTSLRERINTWNSKCCDKSFEKFLIQALQNVAFNLGEGWMGIKASTERRWGDGTEWWWESPTVQLFCKKDSQVIRSCDFFVKYSDYRLDVCSRFYFQLYNLERINHTSLKYIFILIGKSFMDEFKPHTDVVASFSLCGYTWNPTGTLSQAKTDALVTVKWCQPLLKGSITTQQQALLWPTWQETLTGYQGWKHQ